MTLIKQLTEGMGDHYQIYCDLDGVLCDFDARFEHFTGVTPPEFFSRGEKEFGTKITKQKFWDIIDNQVGIQYWRGMSWMPEGKELWDHIKQYKPTLLSAPSMHDNSVIGKTLWVKDNLGNFKIEFRQAEKKMEFSGPNKILIDDREDTILNWKSKNGIGILYTGNTSDTIYKLQQFGI